MQYRHKALGHTVTVKADSNEAARFERLATWEKVAPTPAKKAEKRTPAVTRPTETDSTDE